LPALAFAGTPAAQTFIQMSDLQFGMYTKDQSFAHETVHLELQRTLRPAVHGVGQMP
jgi:hypothetical protein